MIFSVLRTHPGTHVCRLLVPCALIVSALPGQELPLPPRDPFATSAAELRSVLAPLSREDREEAIRREFLSGNVPRFYRTLAKISYPASAGGASKMVSVWVTPEYAALGHDTDYVLMPMSPILAQRLANDVGFILPTKLLVDKIYQASPLKLRPQPIPPSAEMITIPVFYQHKDSVDAQRRPLLTAFPPGTLTGGHKKDVIISRLIYENLKPSVPHPVVIYGWHQLNGQPIQPVYNGHVEWYADYSHGIRFVWTRVLVDDDTLNARDILGDATLHPLLSDAGTVPVPSYTVPTGGIEDRQQPPEGFRLDQNFPNPFNPTTDIRYRVGVDSRRSTEVRLVRLAVFDLLGREVGVLVNGEKGAGTHTAVWDASGFPSGIYYYRLLAGDFVDIRKLVLLR